MFMNDVQPDWYFVSALSQPVLDPLFSNPGRGRVATSRIVCPRAPSRRAPPLVVVAFPVPPARSFPTRLASECARVRPRSTRERESAPVCPSPLADRVCGRCPAARTHLHCTPAAEEGGRGRACAVAREQSRVGDAVDGRGGKSGWGKETAAHVLAAAWNRHHALQTGRAHKRM